MKFSVSKITKIIYNQHVYNQVNLFTQIMFELFHEIIFYEIVHGFPKNIVINIILTIPMNKIR